MIGELPAGPGPRAKLHQDLPFSDDDDDDELPAPHPFFRGADPLTSTVNCFRRWLLLADATPIHAVLGAVAANRLPGGDPIWLGLIGPPSSAKTELLNGLSGLPSMFAVATLSSAGALLSGTSKKEKIATAKGGLLKQIGAFGILVLKDFGSILSMRTEVRAEILAALREIYDGAWTRHVGTDGGVTLEWKGKLGLVFAATQSYDNHHTALAALGERFLLKRVDIAEGHKLLPKAFEHTGEDTQVMRYDIATNVAALFEAIEGRVPRPMSDAEKAHLNETCLLAVRLRATVIRDNYNREIIDIHDPEGTPRLGLALERLLAGLDVIGLERKAALALIDDIALDSVPRLRRKLYEYLLDTKIETSEFAKLVGLPTSSAKRVLEDLNAVGLADREREVNDEGVEHGPILWWRNNSWKMQFQTNGSHQ